MRHWLMLGRIHGADIQQIYQGQPWPYDMIHVNEKLRAGDVVYLGGSYGDVYGWGLITKFERYRDDEMNQERFRVEVIRPVIRNGLIPATVIEKTSLDPLFKQADLNLVELSQEQVRIFRELLSAPGLPLPPEFVPADSELSITESSSKGFVQSQIQCPYCAVLQRSEARYCDNCGKSLQQLNASTIEQTAPLSPSPTPDNLIDRVLDDKYKVVERIGQGGIGVVYRAEHLRIGRDVAIKVLHPQFVSDAQMLDRFRREAKSAAKVTHRNIVAVIDFVEAGNSSPPFIVMEFVSGPTLTTVLKNEGRLAPSRAVTLIREICSAVAAAHAAHISHRDLKPDNVIVVESSTNTGTESVKLIDFGIAKIHEITDGHVITEVGTLIGTPQYMSPEQCRGQSTTVRSDVYSLGVILYEMLAGAPPFIADNRADILSKHLRDKPASLKPFGVPAELDAVVMRALSKNPDQRQSNAALLSTELKGAIETVNSAPHESTTEWDVTTLQAAMPSYRSIAYSPRLNEIDVRVFDAACEDALKRGHLKHVSVRSLMEKLAVGKEEMFDSLEMLSKEGFIQLNATYGSGLPFAHFEITMEGFASYATEHIEDYESRMRVLEEEIATDNKHLFDKPDLVTEHMLDCLASDDLIRLAKYLGGKVEVTYISAVLKRKYAHRKQNGVANGTLMKSRPEFLTELASKVGDEFRYKSRRDAWFKSAEGRKAAAVEIGNLFTYLRDLAARITKQDPDMAISFESKDDDFCVLYCCGMSLTVSWNPGRFVNSLEGSVLHKKISEGQVSFNPQTFILETPKETSHVRYLIDMAPTGEIGWKYQNAEKERGVIPSAALAEDWLTNLMNHVAQKLAGS